MRNSLSGSIVAYAALASGLIAILANFYYMELLSYSVGFDAGAATILNSYNVTPSGAILTALTGSSSLLVAVHITYIMLPFAVIMLSIGIIWLFFKAYARLTSAAIIFASFAFMLMLTLLNIDFPLGAFTTIAPYSAVVLGLGSGVYELVHLSRKPGSKRSIRPIQIDPSMPYSNMQLLSNRLMKSLKGDLHILDMHFDEKAIANLSRLLRNNYENYKNIYILTSSERLGKDFERSYNDFKAELANKSITIELRVMPEDDAHAQHERLIMDESNAYKIPPLNIINKKSEHIVGVSHGEAEKRFDSIWLRSTKYENFNT